jgi:chemotaxis response regulator CheB
VQGVLIAEDAAFMRMRLRSIVEEFRAVVVGEAANG